MKKNLDVMKPHYSKQILPVPWLFVRSRFHFITGKTNGFSFLDILGYLKNTHKNPKVPTWELSWEFPGWDLSHFAKFGIFMGIL